MRFNFFKVKQGNSIGWVFIFKENFKFIFNLKRFFTTIKGIFHNPNTPNVNDKAEQLVLVYVTFNDAIIDVLFVLQPEGGFYPLVLMQPWGINV